MESVILFLLILLKLFSAIFSDSASLTHGLMLVSLSAWLSSWGCPLCFKLCLFCPWVLGELLGGVRLLLLGMGLDFPDEFLLEMMKLLFFCS